MQRTDPGAQPRAFTLSQEAYIMQSIKEIRQATGLSQAKFCEALNIPKRTLEDWEQGKRACPEYVAELIAYRVENDPTIPKTKDGDDI